MKYTVLFLLTLLITFSCDKRCDPGNPSIIGDWSWYKSEGGFSGGIVTPETTGEKITVIITPDSTYKEFLDNKLVVNSKFNLASDPGTGDPYLKFNGMNDLDLEYVDCDVLVLRDRVADGYKKSYTRK